MAWLDLLTKSEDSVEDAPTLEEAERRKHLRRIRRQNHPAFARQRTNVSVSSRKEPGPTEQEKNPHKPFNMWAAARLKAQQPLGEWLGVTIYTFIGIGVNLAAVTSSNEAATMETQYWAWGFATMIGKSDKNGSLDMLFKPHPSRHATMLTFTSQASTYPAVLQVGFSIRCLLSLSRSSAASHGAACRCTCSSKCWELSAELSSRWESTTTPSCTSTALSYPNQQA